MEEQETSINFLTKKKLTRINTNPNPESKDSVFKETWENIEVISLTTLSEIKDFDEFQLNLD